MGQDGLAERYGPKGVAGLRECVAVVPNPVAGLSVSESVGLECQRVGLEYQALEHPAKVLRLVAQPRQPPNQCPFRQLSRRDEDTLHLRPRRGLHQNHLVRVHHLPRLRLPLPGGT